MSTAESPPDPNETRVPEVIVVASMTMLISTVVVALRAMSRALIRQFGPDDWAAIVTDAIRLRKTYIHNFAGEAHSILEVIPLPVLWRLQLPRAQKAVITLVIGLGIITIGVAIARMQWLKLGTDPTWENVPAACWSLTEATTAISCACLPTLKPLVVRAKPLFSKFCKFSSAGESTVELQMTDSAGHIASRSSAVRSNEQLCQDPKEPELVHHYEARPPVEAM
ncbi:hypothetical protein ACJ41O_007458 [Fusarium nematophilum]